MPSTSPKLDIGESKTNLIINYLPQTMSQEEVRSLFSSIGEIESCKLVRDKLTGQSLGYGFVNYTRDEDASRAVASFNGLRLQNKTIKVSFARPSNEGIKGANLYVSGLPKSMTQREMESLFRPYGQIITSRILSDNITGLSKGVGFVRFDKKHEAERAIEGLNGSTPAGCVDQITVKFANNPANNPTKSATLQDVSNLVPLALLNSSRRLVSAGPIHHTPARFRYSPLGTVPVASVQPSADYYTTNAFLQLSAVTAPSIAALAAPVAAPGYSVFVYNLPPDTEDSLIWQLFGPFGAVLNVKLVRDVATAKCKGYGFLTMANYEEALAAMNALNGTQLGSRTLQVRDASILHSTLSLFQGAYCPDELGTIALASLGIQPIA